MEHNTNTELTRTWKKRFDFYEKNGLPGSKEYASAIKALPLLERVVYGGNWFAFFFGIIYFCIIGLWKKGLVLFVGVCLVNIILGVIEASTTANLEVTARMTNLIYAFYCCRVANVAFYLKTVKGIDGWNPFEGFSQKSAAELAALPSKETY